LRGRGLVRGGFDRRRVEYRGGFLGNPRALEKARVLRAPEAHQVGEHEITEVVVVDELLFDELMRFRQRVAEVDNVEMPDIGTEDRVEFRAVARRA